MKVVLLAGGLGSRLAEHTSRIPKPMVPIGDMPVLWHIMKIYSHYGFNDFIICLGYKGSVIRDFFINHYRNSCDVTVNTATGTITSHNNASEDWTITLAETGASSMTGARVYKIRDYLDNKPFLLTYGDGIGNIAIDKLVEHHKAHGKLATMTTYRPLERFGLVQVNEQNEIVKLEEKDKSKELINIGYMVMEPEVFQYFTGKEDELLETEPIQRLVADSQLTSFEHEGFWQPMDTLKDNNDLNALWHRQEVPWKVWE